MPPKSHSPPLPLVPEMRREERQERDEREEELQDKEEEMEEKCQNVHRNKTTLSTTVQTTNKVGSNIIGQKVEFIHSFRKKWKGSFCHRFHRLSPGGRLGGGEETLGHISEHRSRFLACSGALRLLQVIALCILDINIL